MHALDVQPPEINRDENGETGGEPVRSDLELQMKKAADLVGKARQILTGADHADWPGENVVEQERRDRDPSEELAHGVAHDDVNATTHEHGGALQIHRTDREAEQHDAKNEPGGAPPYGLFGDSAGVESRGSEIA